MNSARLEELLKGSLKGEVLTDASTRNEYSRDTSVFTRTPQIVAYPKDADDVSALVRCIHAARLEGSDASVTARAAGTDMSGGPLTDSVLAVFTKHMNHVIEVGDGYAIAEPGVYYRDFEKKTLAHDRQLMPSYPASRELCALGGIVNNDSGGERSLEYGKTRKYVEAVGVVLSDGTKATFSKKTKEEVDRLAGLSTLEGTIYRDMRELITKNKERIDAARPDVSKNSAGYALWEVMGDDGSMNLAKLICGAQGTLALTTRMRLGLVKEQGYRSMLVVFLDDLAILPEIVRRVLAFNPESFESYDDHTFELAIKFLPQMLAQMGLFEAAKLGLSFFPELGMVLKGGVPKLVLMAEFSEDTREQSLFQANKALAALSDLKVQTRIARDEKAAQKYWKVRREAFALLRKRLPGLTAAPFIDDFVVPTDSYPEFLPKLFSILDAEGFVYAVTGHIGSGNFHIFPLLDLKDPKSKELILTLSPKVYDLVIKYGGTTTGEHNDGIIRTPYLEQLFGSDVVALFKETKRIFDPENVFNPGKKVGGTFADIERDMLK